MSTANDILFGSGVPYAKFDAPGVTWSGRIVAISEPYQEREYVKGDPGGGAPKTYPSGDPIMSFSIDLDTGLRDATIEGDDGRRRIYMDGSRIKRAVRDAVKAAGARALVEGSHLSITYTSDEVPGDPRSGKNYAAQYTPGNPASNVLMGQVGQPATPQYQQAPAQPYAPQQPAPQYAPQQPQYAPQQPQYAPQQPVQAAPVQQQPPAPAAPAAPAGPTPEQLAAVAAAGLDPKEVFAGQYPQWVAAQP